MGLALFGLSLLLRLALWAAVAWDLEPRYDETAYVERAEHFAAMARAWTAGDPIAPSDLEGFYMEGRWPPLHPMLLGFVIWVAGPELAWVRLVAVLLSALATWLIYRLACEIAGPRVAVVAALLHAIHPSMLAFSHQLWSENLYIALVLGLLTTLVRIPQSRGTKRWRLLIMAGLQLGLAGLTRAAAIPLFALVPIWIAWRLRCRASLRFAASVAVLGLAILITLPWQTQIRAAEGRTFLLSAFGWGNLHLGNHPDLPPGLGSSWSHVDSREAARGAVSRHSRAHNVHPSIAARDLAIAEVRAHPRLALERMGLRLRMFFSADHFTLRHLVAVVYPPLPRGLLPWIWLDLAIFQWGLLVLAAWGMLISSGVGGPVTARLAHRELLAAVALVAVLPAVVAISMSRLNLPLQACVLPWAGIGALHLREGWTRIRGLVLGGVAALLLWAEVTTLPEILEHYLAPSSYYAEVLGPSGRRAGVTIRCGDQFDLRRTTSEPLSVVRLSVETEGYRFDGARPDNLAWSPPDSIGVSTTLNVYATDPRLPLALGVAVPNRPAATFDPLRADMWQRWVSIVDGVEMRWLGSRTHPPPDEALPKKKPARSQRSRGRSRNRG